jgi:hypothetical protein
MKLEEIHKSHHIESSDDGFDPHSPIWVCKICDYISCQFCLMGEGMDDEDLAKECIGFSWLELTKDGFRKSGTGWPQ